MTEPVTLDFRVRVTHIDEERAREMITGNALDDPFGLVTIEEVIREVPDEEL